MINNSGIVMLGCGGHAKVCIELFRAMSEDVAFCVGNDVSVSDCLGVPILDGDRHLENLVKAGYNRAFVAIGNNSRRQQLGTYLSKMGFSLANALSPSATISPSVRLGNGVAIMSGAVINADTLIDDLVIVNTGATVDHDCRIGSAAHLAPQTALAGNVSVGERALIGVGACVIPDLSIGSDAVIGAGSVVIHQVANRQKVIGISRKSIGSYDSERDV